ncbi:MAG: hypothetical protein HQL28_05660 [Candidatus Omnitrophica bacterium]|nr:hypothetical protein [Candidatus Omnitrophota bacterium]
MFKKTISVFVACSFLLSSVTSACAYDNLAPGLASSGGTTDGSVTQKEVRSSAHLLDVISEELPQPGDILNNEVPILDRGLGIQPVDVGGESKIILTAKDIETVLSKKDVTQLEFLRFSLADVFRRCFKQSGLEGDLYVYEENFALGKGEVPLPRVIRKTVTYKKTEALGGVVTREEYHVQIHPQFLRYFAALYDNDMFFPVPEKTDEKNPRFASVAMGLAYRIARHEFKWQGKSGGHFSDQSDIIAEYPSSERYANNINGRYAIIDDAIMLWFVFSYVQNPGIWLNNKNFGDSVEAMAASDSKSSQHEAFMTYFPNLSDNRRLLEQAKSLALLLNYEYFVAPVVRTIGTEGDIEVLRTAIVSEMLSRNPLVSEASEFVSDAEKRPAVNCGGRWNRPVKEAIIGEGRSEEVRASGGVKGVMDAKAGRETVFDRRVLGLSRDALGDIDKGIGARWYGFAKQHDPFYASSALLQLGIKVLAVSLTEDEIKSRMKELLVEYVQQGFKEVYVYSTRNGKYYAMTAKHSVHGEEIFCSGNSLPVFEARSGLSNDQIAENLGVGIMFANMMKWSPQKTIMFADIVNGLISMNTGIPAGGKVERTHLLNALTRFDFVDIARLMDLYRKLENYKYVGISMGGSKALIEIKNGLREILDSTSFEWDDPVEKGGFGERGINVKNDVSADEVTDALARSIKELLQKNGLKVEDLGEVYNCSTGPLEETRELIGSPEPTTNLPFKDYAIMEEIAKRLYGNDVDRLRVSTSFVLQHDGKGGIVGEFKETPGVSGVTIIHGTGENATAMKNGVHYTADGAITEWGHATVGTPIVSDTKPIKTHTYRFIGGKVKQNHPLQVVYEIPEGVKGTTREKQYVKPAAAEEMMMDRSAAYEDFIWQNKGEYDVEDLTSGGALDKLLTRKADLAATFGGTTEDYAGFNEGKDISIAAAAGNERAKSIIRYIAGEMGRALVPFIFKYRAEDFSKNITMVSSVGEKLGLGVDVDERGRDLYLRSMQEACETGLIGAGMQAVEAASYSAKIKRSPGSADREITAAAPQVRPYAKPDDALVKSKAADLVAEGITYFLPENIFSRDEMTELNREVKTALKGSLETFTSLDDLSRKIAAAPRAKRSVIDFGGMIIKQKEIENFYANNPHVMQARMLNSEIPDMKGLSKFEKEEFRQRLLLRMGIVRGLTKEDVETVSQKYMLARYYMHPYLQLGFDIDDLLLRIVSGPDNPKEVFEFVRNAVYIIKAMLRFRPIETYSLTELETFTKVLWSA